MPTYILLMNWTSKGAQDAKAATARADLARQGAKEMGGEMKGVYMVMGQYDFVAIFEMPDDETMAKFVIRTSQMGFVETETLRAFTEDEYRKLLDEM